MVMGGAASSRRVHSSIRTGSHSLLAATSVLVARWHLGGAARHCLRRYRRVSSGGVGSALRVCG
eukprot:2181219-Pyramimonas_sp.AAC.1